MVIDYGTYTEPKLAIKYADYIEIFSGVAIIILGLQSMIENMGVKSLPINLLFFN